MSLSDWVGCDDNCWVLEVCVYIVLCVAELSNSRTYYKFFSHLPLKQPAATLCGYDSSRRDVLDVLHVPVHFRFTSLGGGPTSWAWTCSQAWGSCFGMTLAPTFTTSPPPGRKSGQHCLTAFTHRPLLNPVVSPVIQPLCRIPLASPMSLGHFWTWALSMLLDFKLGHCKEKVGGNTDLHRSMLS